jgi:hypothetical protein
MKYVSAEWVDNPMGSPNIKAVGDDGKEYWIPSVDTDVPPWPEFLAEGNVVADPAGVAPPPVEKSEPKT